MEGHKRNAIFLDSQSGKRRRQKNFPIKKSVKTQNCHWPQQGKVKNVFPCYLVTLVNYSSLFCVGLIQIWCKFSKFRLKMRDLDKHFSRQDSRLWWWNTAIRVTGQTHKTILFLFIFVLLYKIFRNILQLLGVMWILVNIYYKMQKCSHYLLYTHVLRHRNLKFLK